MIYVTLEGLPIYLESGPVQQEYSAESGTTDARLSNGRLVRMHHWRKESITLSGQGWMGAGLDGLEYSQPLELRCTQPKSITTGALSAELTSAPRPDVEPWAMAKVQGDWVSTQCSLAGAVASITPVAGASAYRVSWMPMYTVLCQPPREALDPSSANYQWSFTAKEV